MGEGKEDEMREKENKKKWEEERKNSGEKE
jgi:hypothetical protein